MNKIMIRGASPFWKRLVAYIIDVFIVSVIIVKPFMNKFESIEPSSITEVFSSFSTMFSKEIILSSLVIAILTLFYWTFLEYKFGQTVGKVLMRTQVSSVNRKKLTLTQIITRNVTKLSSFLLILDTIYLLVKRNDQRFTDTLAKTTVTEEKRK
jgi:uncharacterized RDD family membrane protein YckC